MTRLEMVEQIREKTNVTYDEAREALEKNNWDMLDAIVGIERMKQPISGSANEQSNANEATDVPAKKRVVRHYNSGEAADKIASVVKWLGTWIQKGERLRVEILHKDEVLFSLSITTIAILFLLKWWLMTILVIAGLFTGYRFRFSGSTLLSKAANAAASKVESKAEEFVAHKDEE